MFTNPPKLTEHRWKKNCIALVEYYQAFGYCASNREAHMFCYKYNVYKHTGAQISKNLKLTFEYTVNNN